jgi:hypothetical protein
MSDSEASPSRNHIGGSFYEDLSVHGGISLSYRARGQKCIEKDMDHYFVGNQFLKRCVVLLVISHYWSFKQIVSDTYCIVDYGLSGEEGSVIITIAKTIMVASL